MIRIITFCIFILGAFSLNAQSYTTKKTVKGKTKKLFDKAMEYTIGGDNERAIKEFDKVLKEDPTFIDAQIQWAAVQYDMANLANAEKGFEQVLAIDPLYNPKVYYTLGVTEMKLKKFGEAANHFEAYIKVEKKNQTLIEKAKNHVSDCRLSEQAYANPVPFDPKSLGTNINTEESEYLPSLTADGATMVYTARFRGQEDFYISKKENGEWIKGKPLDEVNTLANEGAQSISADGKFLVFTACDRKDGYGSCDLYYSENKDGHWTKPRNIGAPINTRAWESQPAITANGKALYFASNRTGGKGAKDIWISYRQEDGKWGTPENLGDVINTSSEDKSPFIHADGQTLYFTSNGHPGMGGHDLFLARKDTNNKWGTPENLGFPINTKAHEAALVVSLDGQTAYFSTDRNDLESGKIELERPDKGEHLDIYSFSLYEAAQPQAVTYVKARVFDATTKEKLNAKVHFIDLKTGEPYASAISDNEGEFLVCLPIGSNFSLNVSKEKYLFHSENFALDKTNKKEEPYLLDIGLQRIPDKLIAINNPNPEVSPGNLPKSEPIILKNVFFETGSAALRNESLIELQNLRQLLLDYPSMHIRLNGHTDNVGSEADNSTLSQNRAKAVYDYLINNGIDAKRLGYKGFGESKPIDTNDTIEGRQNNRRTEFIIVE